jgi:replication factor C small subunit
MLWAESYRPVVLDDVLGQDHIVDRLKFMVADLHQSGADGGFPHLMFAGPAGVGKTSCAMALMRSMFGEDWNANFVELNASDERSIQVIRTKVKEFARRGVIGTYLVDGQVRPIPFNVVFLDECDNLTPDAQSALRRIMEVHSKTTRFILSCNYPHKLIDPVKDRCAFSDTRFRPIPKTNITDALTNVVVRENLDIEPDAIAQIAVCSRGSMRKALNILFATTRVPTRATVDDVDDVVAELSPKARVRLLQTAFRCSQEQDPAKYREFARRMDKQVENLAEQGFSGSDILDSIFRATAEDKSMPVSIQRTIFSTIGDALHHASISQDDILTVKAWLRRLKT